MAGKKAPTPPLPLPLSDGILKRRTIYFPQGGSACLGKPLLSHFSVGVDVCVYISKDAGRTKLEI